MMKKKLYYPLICIHTKIPKRKKNESIFADFSAHVHNKTAADTDDDDEAF